MWGSVGNREEVPADSDRQDPAVGASSHKFNEQEGTRVFVKKLFTLVWALEEGMENHHHDSLDSRGDLRSTKLTLYLQPIRKDIFKEFVTRVTNAN